MLCLMVFQLLSTLFPLTACLPEYCIYEKCIHHLKVYQFGSRITIIHCFSLIFKVKIDTTTIPAVMILMADHSSLLKCNLNIGL